MCRGEKEGGEGYQLSMPSTALLELDITQSPVAQAGHNSHGLPDAVCSVSLQRRGSGGESSSAPVMASMRAPDAWMHLYKGPWSVRPTLSRTHGLHSGAALPICSVKLSDDAS
eukprot:COSAG02_NODE_266_length_26580_cov_9.209207_8_plen_113_part_00